MNNNSDNSAVNAKNIKWVTPIDTIRDLGVNKELITNDVINFFGECKKAINLYAKKNHDYGNSFAKGCKEIGNAYAVGRLYDKMSRLINLTRTKACVSEESFQDTVMDLACYALMFNAYRNNR